MGSALSQDIPQIFYDCTYYHVAKFGRMLHKILHQMYACLSYTNNE